MHQFRGALAAELYHDVAAMGIEGSNADVEHLADLFSSPPRGGSLGQGATSGWRLGD